MTGLMKTLSCAIDYSHYVACVLYVTDGTLTMTWTRYNCIC
jgi:hypothetical protein